MDVNNHSEEEGTVLNKEMLNALFTGDEEAKKAFLKKCTKLIYSYVDKTLKFYKADFLYNEVEDIHNDIFLSLIDKNYKKLKSFKGKNDCSVASWIRVVTVNSTINRIKKDKSHIPIDDSSNSQEEPDVEFVKRESEKILKELKKELNTVDRLFFKLYFEKKRSPKEIAKILNITESTVYSKKSRIIGKLRKIAKKNKILQEI